MSLFKMKATKALGLVCAAALSLSLVAAPAFAEPTDDAASEQTPAAEKVSYAGTTYTVKVYGGNQGTINGQDSVVIDDVAPGETVDFSSLAIEVPEDSKYYAKGIRLAALDNVRSDNIRGEEVTSTVYYANVSTDGSLVAAAPAVITEDTDFVVAYGIQANRVAYTVTYSDADGNEIAPSQQFFGDIGDVPATAAAYIEGYVPRADVLTKTLTANEAENVFPFVYDRLAEGYTTVPNPDGTVTIIAPDGSTVPDAYRTTVTATTPTATTVDAAEADAEGDEGVTPLVTDAGTEVISDEGAPLAAPTEENLDDNETPMAAGATPGAEQPANTAWIPWAVAAAAIALLIVFILLRGRKKQNEATEV
ncbi:MucBP domain-containing protein [Adlercreutzia equolifaciens]|uniref:MucBP domain-containing protein n=1 Tax=Adlercreutzia equolifaciens TaxID=446660 RepID=UPI0023B1C986|nr:MucBP domain-containing protein [Adlercreutzia equolifaciens]MDE8701641.1 MucBP domain-containing protein [Adlercreutzia equolifaciens]